MEASRIEIKKIKNIMLDLAYRSGKATHFGGAFSCLDFVYLVFNEYMGVDFKKIDRNYFILSKGHTVLALYGVLNHQGIISDEIFDQFLRDGSKFISHPIMNVEIGIESSNGSLGQGVSMACGIALGLKKIKSNKKVFCVLGDGECNEGSVWEAVQFATAHDLNNLIFYVDVNGFQNDGTTSESLTELPFDNIFNAFGWNVKTVNGHDYEEIKNAIENTNFQTQKPNAIIGKTIKGNGISFMENNADWHNNVLSEKLYTLAKLELS